MANTYSWANDAHDASKDFAITMRDLDYSENFAKKFEGNSRVDIVNVKSAIDIPEMVTYQIEDINNVYAGRSDIDPTLYAPSKKGKSFVVKRLSGIKVPKADSGYESDVVAPIQTHIVCKFPNMACITASDLKLELERVANMLYATANDTTRINEIMRGSLSPFQN